MSELLLDLRYAFRALARSPAFAVTAVFTLALGIGATTAIFSVTHETLLSAPAVHAPDRLAVLYTTSRRGNPRSASSYPDFLDYRSRSRDFRDMAAYSWVPLSADGEREAGLATGQLVTGNYFAVLGVPAAAGRMLLSADDARGAGQPVVVLSDGFWRQRFGGALSAVGTTLRLNGMRFTVVGVAPAHFRGLTAGRGPDLWLPMFAGPLLGEGVGAAADAATFEARGDRWLAGVVGRLRDGATLDQARGEMLEISRRLAAEDPDRGSRSITVDPLPRRILPLGTEGDVARFLALLLGVVTCTLVLASTNLANLLLARASSRQREMGIRLAVGAGRARLVRQLLTESVVLAGLGAAAGVVVALLTLDLLAGFELPGGVALGDLAVRADGRLLATALACAGGSAVLFGLVPAFQATRAPVLTALRGDAGPGAGGRLRRWLVAVQVALCLVLLVGSGLFLRTLQRAFAFDPGFRAERVAVARFSLSLLRYAPEARAVFVDRLMGAVSRIPGIATASLATLVPLQPGGHRGTVVAVEGYEPAPGEDLRVDFVHVGPEYFDVLGVPIVHGRPFLASDDRAGRPVAVVSRATAQRWWAGREALGATLRLGGRAYQVVGVADDVVWEELGETATPYVFLALAQAEPALPGTLTLVVRTTVAPTGVLPSLRREIRGLDPDLSLTVLGTLTEWLERTLAPQRMGATLLTLFALLALAIAALGVYGVVGYAVARQTRTIGLRIALGAPRRHVAGMVARGIAGPVGAGLAAGLVASWALAMTVERFLFRVAPHDPVVFLTVALGLSAVATLATLGPAGRAARLDPAEALRHE